MRILHLTTHWTGGGSEANIAHTVECLRDAGHEVHLAIGRVVEPDRGPLPTEVEIHRVEALARPPRVLADARAFAELRHLLRRRRFDLVHTHLSKAGFIGRMAADGSAAVVHTVHNPITLGTTVYRALDRLTARRTRAFVFVGEELRRAYAEGIGIPWERTRVIRSPVGADTFVRIRARSRPALATGLRAVVISRLERQKGVENLPQLLAGLPELVVDVAGDGRYARELRADCAAAGVSQRVTFHGYVNRRDLVDLLAHAHVLIHVSPTEGLPQAVVQALAAGVPVVAVRAVGVSELVTDGVNGLVSERVDAVATTVRRLVGEEGLLARLADGARRFDPSPWIEREICRRQLELVEELTERR